MTAAQTYWLTDPDGTFAPVEGASRRDEQVTAGWVLADQPSPTDLVWAHHPGINGWSRFAAVVLPAWQARGWVPTTPPTVRVDTGLAVVLPEPGQALPESELIASPAVTPPPADKPTTKTEKKEQGLG